MFDILTILPTARIFPDTVAYAPTPVLSHPNFGGMYSGHKLDFILP